MISIFEVGNDFFPSKKMKKQFEDLNQILNGKNVQKRNKLTCAINTKKMQVVIYDSAENFQDAQRVMGEGVKLHKINSELFARQIVSMIQQIIAKEEEEEKKMEREKREEQRVREITTGEVAKYIERKLQITNTLNEEEEKMIKEQESTEMMVENQVTEEAEQMVEIEEVVELEQEPSQMETTDPETEEIKDAVSENVEEPVIESETAQKTTISEIQSQRYKEEQEKVKKFLNSKGIKVENSINGSVKIAESLDGKWKLNMKAMKPRKSQLKYKLYEVDSSGETDELENDTTIITPDEAINGKSKINTIICNMQGNYDDDITNIKMYISTIAKYRLLEPVVIDCDVLSIEKFLGELKMWFVNHSGDPRVASFEMAGRIHVAIVKRGEKTLYNILRDVIAEIAPANKPSGIKDALYANGYLIHDEGTGCNDTQKTLSHNVMAEIGATGDKCFSFDFGEEFNQNFYEMYLDEQGILEYDETLKIINKRRAC